MLKISDILILARLICISPTFLNTFLTKILVPLEKELIMVEERKDKMKSALLKNRIESPYETALRTKAISLENDGTLRMSISTLLKDPQGRAHLQEVLEKFRTGPDVLK